MRTSIIELNCIYETDKDYKAVMKTMYVNNISFVVEQTWNRSSLKVSVSYSVKQKQPIKEISLMGS